VSDAAPPASAHLLGLTARIVSAHARRNPVAAEQLPELIRSVYRAFGRLGQGGATTPADAARPEPAVPIRRSVAHDRLTCLECGGRFRMLKRHLGIEHGLTPEAYRARWRLPRDYPTVAPGYAAVRSGLAKATGLGRRRDEQAQDELPLPEAEVLLEVSTAAPDTAEAERPGKRRGRKRDGQPDTPDTTMPAAGADTPSRARGRGGRRRARDAGAG